MFEYLPFTVIMKYGHKDFKENFKNFSEVFKKMKNYLFNSKHPINTKYPDFFPEECNKFLLNES